jgi:hypothetical protein
MSYGKKVTVVEKRGGPDQDQFSYTINKLTPGSRTYCRVIADDKAYTGSFMTAPSQDAISLVFYGLGDTILDKDSMNSVNKLIMEDLDKDFQKNGALVLHSSGIAWMNGSI